MKIATWNVNSIRQRLDHILQWSADAQPDVLCLQETKVVDEDFPAEALRDAGFVHQLFEGQKSYNGVAILSRLPLSDTALGHSTGEPDPQKRLAMATVGGVRVINCYVPMGTSPTSDKFLYKLKWLVRLRAELNRLSPTDKVLLCGDLNVARADLDSWDPFRTEGKILCHPHERMALSKVMDWGLVDAFRELNRDKRQFSWWDYRGGSWQKNQGFRIDYILATAALLEHITEVSTHEETRGWDTPSDHVPVMAHISL